MKPKPDTLEWQQQMLTRIGHLEHQVDSMGQTQAFALRAESEKHRDSIFNIFRQSRRRAQIYLAADGSRSVQEIADHLGMKRQNVGADLRILGEEGMLGIAGSEGGRDLWAKKPIDRTLRITQLLTEMFSLARDGRPAVAKSGGRKGQKKR